MNNEIIDVVIVIAMVVVCLLMGVYIAASTEIHTQAREVMSACESTLPRNQHCILVAIPESNSNE